MPDPKNAPASSEPPPQITYNNPRRTSPENSITLRHHRLAGDGSKHRSPAPVPAATSKPSRRNSSGGSNETGLSDAKRWFDLSNQNAMGNMDTTAMDVDPPFFQKESDSSNEEAAKYAVPSQSPAYRFVQSRTPGLRPKFTQSSSADDYRSVIDDLTVENKRLREELKKYRQMGPDSLRKDKLFEVKVHGLPSRKKRELEAALRDFTTSLEGSSTASPSRKKSSNKSKNNHFPTSKHASSSSGSNSRPVDSAYASMSNGPDSSVPSLPGQAHAARQRNKQNIENYLRDIPERLWPRSSIMTEKEKKQLVVKRLEQLFTGKMGNQSEQVHLPLVPEPIMEDMEMQGPGSRSAPPNRTAREARIRPRESGRTSHSQSRDNISPSNSNSNGDQVDSRDNGNGSGSGSGRGCGRGGSGSNTTSPPTIMPPPEQRPTRPHDLDPDRRQVPSDNMNYIRHLGLVAPEAQQHYSAKDVSPDAEGWVYLNLLCNLAQLHILNVTSDFVRNAVSEKSTKFQLSPDGRKIRWRGGAEGTRFSSDSSGSDSQRNQSGDDTDGSNKQDQRKKQKTQASGNDVNAHKPSKFGPWLQDSNSSESFHYKPLFVHQQTSSSDEQPSLGDETGSSYGPPEESNLGMNSRWGQSGVSGVSQRKRRRDGAIIYYSGAPFCTDLSGDFVSGEFGEASPDTYDMTSSGGQATRGPVSLGLDRPQFSRSTSGSSIPFRPLTAPKSAVDVNHNDDDLDPPELTSGETDDDIEADFPWSNDSQQSAPLVNLEASGLGGTYPEDHFVVTITTRRPKHVDSDGGSSSCNNSSSSSNNGSSDDEGLPARPRVLERPSHETTDSKTTTESVVGGLAHMTTGSPMPLHVSYTDARPRTVEIEYVSSKVRRLPPVPLPPPAFYFPSCDSDLDEDESSGDDDDDDDDFSHSLISRQAILEDDPTSDVELSGNDEEDEHSDDALGYHASGSISPENIEEMDDVSELGRGRGRKMLGLSKITTGSSAATAGGPASGFNSSTSMEDV
ncbi:frequency clock protein [Xylariaceae sp. FL0662B]|nr:frequency clock protein [Xylariaceae sp. FL0662B]